jgi:DNA-binding IclR family transcriptional regulator
MKSNPRPEKRRKGSSRVPEEPGRKYQAPALEKGLDIIELLAATSEPLSQHQLAKRLGRSVGEIFRMLISLERRGYVSRREGDGAYQLTLRLFELAHGHPPMERLLANATDEMQKLAELAGQSCHLTVYRDGILVVAQAESPRPRGFTIKLGTSFPLWKTASGRVLTAFQPPSERKRRVDRMLAEDAVGPPRPVIERRLTKIRARGFEEARSDVVQGVTDLCFPLLNHLGAAVAALAMPFVAMTDNVVDRQVALGYTAAAAERLSRGLGFTK